MPSILFLFNSGAIQLRSNVIQKFITEGYAVKCVLPESEIALWKTKIPGVEWVPCQVFSGTSMGLLNNIKMLLGLYGLLKKEKPDIVFLGNVKPNIYAGIAARLLGIKSIYGLVSGLGYAFIDEPGIKRKLAKWICMKLYQLSFRGFSQVFFQNRDDADFFIRKGLISPNLVTVVPGTGVDLEAFKPKPLPANLTFFMAARLIREKGVFHFVEAAKELKKRYPEVRFVLGGGLDTNPSAMREAELKDCANVVDYIGYCSDMEGQINASSVFVYPSYYREGVPRSLLEALACARTVITTDSVGCKETVIDGQNGFKIVPRSTEALIVAMEHIIQNPSLLQAMGQESRHLAEKRFDIHTVNELMFQTVKQTHS